MREFPPQLDSSEEGDVTRGLKIRLNVRCESDGTAAVAELDMGERNKFYPSDAALAVWRAETGNAGCQLVWRSGG